MSNPAPQSIQLKRKRDDEAINTLYLEQENTAKKYRPTNSSHDHIYVFRRVAHLANGAQDSSNTHTGATLTIPGIRLTEPGEEDRNPYALKRLQPIPVKRKAEEEAPQANETSAEPTQNGSILQGITKAPRRFHLARSRHSHRISKKGTRRGARSGMALFVEEQKGTAVTSGTGEDTTIPADAASTGEASSAIIGTELQEKLAIASATNVTSTKATTQKRPTAWRTPGDQTPNRQSSQQSTSREKDSLSKDYDPHLLAKMENLAEDLRAHNADSTLVEAPGVQDDASVLKSEGDANLPTVGDGDMELDDDSDYVLETYVRELVPVSEVNMLDPTIGRLVILPEDEEEWDLFAEQDSDDREFDTDDEDSNAEDFYTHDYPEEELSSGDEDDEVGQFYNKYRRNGSEGEEYDLEYWDEEEQDHVAWNARRKGASSFPTRSAGSEESDLESVDGDEEDAKLAKMVKDLEMGDA